MRTCMLPLTLALSGLLAPTQARAQYLPARPDVPVYQMVCRINGDFLYTNDAREIDSAGTYDYQGVSFYAAPEPGPGLVPLRRYMMQTGPNTFLHRLGTGGAPPGFHQEMVAGYISREPRRGLKPLHVWYNPREGQHHYTTAPASRPIPGLRYAGILGYVRPTGL